MRSSNSETERLLSFDLFDFCDLGLDLLSLMLLQL
jgi:hypothetical protein